jgi:tripartite-type tricarboxylate transporter receptor subunit TctC
MRKFVAGAGVVALSVAGLSWVSAAGAAQRQAASQQQFVVVYAAGASTDAAHAAIAFA